MGADDKHKRDTFGDKSGKKDTTEGKKSAVAPKDNFGGDGKRTYHRHSGTGQNTFNKFEKKSGEGKGNWGSDTVDRKEGETSEKVAENDQPEEPEIPVVSLDDYLKDNAMNLEYKVEEDDQSGPVTVGKEKGFKQVQKKEADWTEANTKQNDTDKYTKTKTNQIEGVEGQQGRYNNKYGNDRGGAKKPAKKNLNNDDFPALG